ncbi:exonuclease SbcCD subunit D [Solirubrobacter ginsenosidimutans]|uniref:Nuclease SbcCD subunit D n=1 Tax=Solirubrobacter ginsenosidimutans TaxID=490573 RepID=A0A9X3MSW6_9ACTN|nr:exonuclease SbcCD subunit D [Solirubrobacter ginsenosidimutans]MDA0160595.1 exonuclease SbcCD subunit D [Solirubrobacter ginsenosidimutans]
MRLLHTGDWHVGRTLHRRQRLDECAAVLGELVEVAAAEAVDAVLVCGDVFEHFAPSAEAESIVYRTLLALRATGAEVVVIPGNHDYARRFAAVEGLFAAAGVTAVSSVRRPDQGGIVRLTARDGTALEVACLPWVGERTLSSAADLMLAQERPYQEYADELASLIAALCAPLDPAAVTVLAGHLFVSGARTGGGERDLTIGQVYAVSPAALPTTVQYIALGHVHRPQDVPGAATPARYAGSPLQLDFGEAAQRKTVTIVDVEPARPPRTREVEITRGRSLLEIRGTLEELAERAGEFGEAWLKVELVCDGPAPGLADRVRDLLPNALEVRLDYEREDAERRAGELRRLSAHDLFARYFRETHGADADQAVMKLFDELLEEVGGAPTQA